MPESQPSIERLPVPTQAKLRSTQLLTSVPQVVSKLVQNSLDANAAHIDIGLDCKEWMCWVRDDGHGINKAGLESFGQGEGGGRYNTSKTYEHRATDSSSTFGFRGEALASAADVACMEICSRTEKSRKTWSIILKGGKKLYFGPAVRWKRESAGTTVHVRDIFYNLPVRRLSHSSPPRTWELVRREIETYSLMFPHVTFSLEDTTHAGEPSQQKDRIVRIPKTASTLDSFRHLYGDALTEHTEAVDITSGSMRIEGFISLTGATSKVYQFLYINRHPVTIADLGRVIDSQFASSSFGKNALDEVGERDLPRSTIRRSPRKSEKKAVYVLNISITPDEVDNFLDPAKNIIQLRNKTNVLSFLSSAIQSFLVKNGFLNQVPHSSTRSSPSPRKRKKLNLDESDFAEHDSIRGISSLSLEVGGQATPSNDSVGLYTSTAGISKEIMWTDSATGEQFVINSRTGNSFCQTSKHPGENEKTGFTREEGRRTLRQQETKTVASTSTEPREKKFPMWLEKALESNRTYAMAESRIPSVKVPPPIPSDNDLFQSDKHACHKLKSSLLGHFKLANFDSCHETGMHRFTKADIQQAEIINQVDRKFIACRIPKHTDTTSNSMLVLIDQHAADERVRVEFFLKELLMGFLHSQDQTDAYDARGIRIRELNPPQPVLLTQHEALTIKRSQDARDMLCQWGVRFSTDLDDALESGSTGYSQLLVRSIPEVVSDKLLQGDELRDFIKGFLGQIQSGELVFSDSRLDFPPEADQDEFFWLKAVRRCPRGLLDLINSKACRGAIMFNDSLSVTQCETLVKQLSKTVFPFQCAHGRPSLVPLIDTGEIQASTHIYKRGRKDWNRLETIGDV
ncbi:hypothetical protein M413DRAFT_441520 [Hebeloma cylindrosporum]|uniref:MutL C-terminal dimerisation domain-containing protein n=1 Tax=Hebeloma cylindrosporum TaxID=76867 RepID=A0A0C3CR87_HEBCY|nr:hypothetical protein M413DRAFT_441520 [Hebeloma cylindrosporum h7]